MKNIKVNIAIQCRKKNTRLPDKSSMRLNREDLTVIDSLIQNCVFCSSHVRKKTSFYGIIPSIYVLVPDDELDYWRTFLRGYKGDVNVMGGDHNNVLKRYLKLWDCNRPDYIVRLTADCPNVPALTINKLIFTAVHHSVDYLSNAWPNYRTSIDGHDCEIVSSAIWQFLAKTVNYLNDYDLEHVTSFIHRTKPTGFSYGSLWTKEDLSDLKTCIDTQDDYDLSFKRFDESTRKKVEAVANGIRIYEY